MRRQNLLCVYTYILLAAAFLLCTAGGGGEMHFFFIISYNIHFVDLYINFVIG